MKIRQATKILDKHLQHKCWLTGCTCFKYSSVLTAQRVWNRHVNRVLKLQLKPLPDYGDHMLLAEFVDCCRSRSFCDNDGTGYYATDNAISGKQVSPSEVIRGAVDNSFSHVMWFNK